MQKTLIQSLFFLLIVTSVSAQDVAAFFSKSDSFFKTNVIDGRVEYAAIKSNPKALNEVLNSAKGISVSKSDTATYKAFWINAYNLLVIDGIVKNYPLKSPLDVAGFFDKIKHEVGGRSITLNDIENDLLRAEFPTEARFHFVLVCAGLGCPPIVNTAYTPNILESQLQMQTVLALNNPNFIKVNENKVEISQLFEWYKSDFEQKGSIVDFINIYRKEQLPENAKISYYPYDWSLNEAN
ncbi:DUF547 domain-containing protein [Maribacter hydrothermalis]|uniref:DUF547 domain-containing protein n=1 Tax=Maribacter hydrothermalis TaxID=1836467 RepID=A0A1B7YY03_9FLAO|nr:DUF547 domain-containing protein [Maribacter hydrothermalis]APQ16905.1 DUF547 domain-containing protein [Maribacter hydrothermalis]OBR35333.1 hypothetical protein A9200_12265 [Maribacter hydrothermalis]